MIDSLLNRLIGILIITHQLKSGLVVAHLQAHSQVLNGVNRQLTWPPAGLNNTFHDNPKRAPITRLKPSPKPNSCYRLYPVNSHVVSPYLGVAG